MLDLPTAAEADVGLLLEGTYPFVRGGVSNWVQQIIEGMPELRFALIFLGAQPDDYPQGLRYSLPDNVVHCQVHYLFQPIEKEVSHRCPAHVAAFEKNQQLHQSLRQPNTDNLEHAVCDLHELLTASNGINEEQFNHSKASWDYICAMYDEYCSDPSFLDYFWTIRNLHKPLWQFTDILKSAPSCKLYHSVATGYAGFLGALLHQRYQCPFIISEHGIYTKERRIDLLQQHWNSTQHNQNSDPTQVSYQRQLWVRFFESLARMSYVSAATTVSLFQDYHQQQIADGAAPERARIIPNGVELSALLPLIEQRGKSIPQVMCLLGRVVPIKDIKTFIRSVSVVAKYNPAVEAWIVGPEEENPEYVTECRNLVESMGLTQVVHFKGMQKIADILPKIGVMVLSSISEGLPLVVLEAFAAGVPVVATDVGACRELIYGKDDDDKALGKAGEIVGIADPLALASAVNQLLSNQQEWTQAQSVAIKRVQRYYDLRHILNEYRDLYQTVMEQ